MRHHHNLPFQFRRRLALTANEHAILLRIDAGVTTAVPVLVNDRHRLQMTGRCRFDGKRWHVTPLGHEMLALYRKEASR